MAREGEQQIPRTKIAASRGRPDYRELFRESSCESQRWVHMATEPIRVLGESIRPSPMFRESSCESQRWVHMATEPSRVLGESIRQTCPPAPQISRIPGIPRSSRSPELEDPEIPQIPSSPESPDLEDPEIPGGRQMELWEEAKPSPRGVVPGSSKELPRAPPDPPPKDPLKGPRERYTGNPPYRLGNAV